VPIAGSTAAIAGLTLTAESLAGRRNRIGTVTVEGPHGPGQPSGRARTTATAPADVAVTAQTGGN